MANQKENKMELLEKLAIGFIGGFFAAIVVLALSNTNTKKNIDISLPKSFLEQLEEELEDAIENEDFEKAANIRDQLKELKSNSNS